VSGQDDTNNALNAALAMKSRVDSMNAVNLDNDLPLMKTGIGLHSGEVVAGNLGSANRMNYTVIGDAVNLASRLEALTKQYGADILVSEDTRNQGSGFVYRETDMVRVKGKTKPVRIYELMGKTGQVSQQLQADIDTFETALAHYREQQWDSAFFLLEKLAEDNPDALLYKLFLDRIAAYRKVSPGTDWDGVFTFESK